MLRDTEKEQRMQAYSSEMGQWAVYYTRPQSFTIMFSYWLAYQLWGL